MRLFISAWASELIPKIASPVTFYVIAKYLGPEQYGIATTILTFLAFTRFFWDWGLSKLIQLNEYDKDENITLSLYINIILAILVSIIIINNSDKLGNYLFGGDQYNNIIKLSVLIVLTQSLSLIPVGVLLNQKKYNIIKNSQLCNIIIYLFSILIFLYFEFGYQSAIYATILSQTVQSIYLLVNARLDYKIKDYDIKKNIGHKSILTLLSYNYENFIVWNFIYLDFFLIANKLSQQEIGYYRASIAISITIVSIFGQSLFNYVFQSTKNEKHNLNFKAVTVNIRIFSLVWTNTLLILFNINILEYILGPKWHGIGHVLQITLSCIAIGYITECNSELYKIISKSHYYSAGQTISAGILFLAIYYLECNDINEFIEIKFIVSIISVLIQIYIQFLVFKIKFNDLFIRYIYLVILSLISVLLAINLQKNTDSILYGIIVGLLVIILFNILVVIIFKKYDIISFKKKFSIKF